MSQDVSARSASRSFRSRRREREDEARAVRALSLVHMGELSAARQALEGAPVAPGTHASPALPREPLRAEIANLQPSVPFQLDTDLFLVNLRKSRRGAAPGPSGMHSDHLFPLLERPRDSELLAQVASAMAVGDIPDDILDIIRLGRVTALQKPDGGIRGIVVGYVLRRLVARTIVKQVEEGRSSHCSFQYALSTETGCECVAHILQTFTDVDERATIVSINGIGAYDLISRNAMLQGLPMMENGDRVLSFVRCFYGSPSTYMWEDEMGVSQDIPQGEGGEQGDLLMPMSFALGQHRALLAIQERFLEGERVFAFLDDIYVVCMPERVGHHSTGVVCSRDDLSAPVWNRGGVVPQDIDIITAAARVRVPDAVVWRGAPELPATRQGLKVLGAPSSEGSQRNNKFSSSAYHS